MNGEDSIGQYWIFALAAIFGLTVLVLTFNVVFKQHLAPVLTDNLPNDDTGLAAENGINFFMNIWTFLPYIVLAMIVIFIFLITVKKEPIEREYR